MKIIFCLHHFLPEYVAGTEIYTLRLAQHLNKDGIEAVVLIPFFDQPATVEYEYEGIRVIRYAENSVEDRQMIMGKRPPDSMDEFVRIIKAEQPDIIHFHELAPGRATSIFHVQKMHDLQIPVVLTFHLSYYICIKNSFFYRNEKKCDGVIREKVCTACVFHDKNIEGLKSTMLLNTAMALFNLNINTTGLNNTAGTALGFPFVINNIKQNLARLSNLSAKIVVVAEWFRDMLEKNGVPASKIAYIKQGLTSSNERPAVHRKNDSPLKLVYIGRITESKGLHLLIDAVCRLPEEKVLLHIYGKETEAAYINRCKQIAGANKNICWQGVVPSEEVIPRLSQYDLLCLPSVFSEMSPLVIQEAFAAGIPVLASNVYGNVEQIKDGVNGWLFRFNDSVDLCEKLDYLTSHPEAIENAMMNLPESYSFGEVGKKYLELYKTILNSKGQG